MDTTRVKKKIGYEICSVVECDSIWTFDSWWVAMIDESSTLFLYEKNLPNNDSCIDSYGGGGLS
jgi:hypothetical protein